MMRAIGPFEVDVEVDCTVNIDLNITPESLILQRLKFTKVHRVCNDDKILVPLQSTRFHYVSTAWDPLERKLPWTSLDFHMYDRETEPEKVFSNLPLRNCLH